MQQGADRCRGNHGCRQPTVEGHQSGFADAKGKKRIKNTDYHRRAFVCQDASGVKCRRSGKLPGPDHRQQQESHRGAHQNTEIDAPAPSRFIRTRVGDERVGGQRKQFVEKKEGEQVLRQGHPHSGADRNREKGKEPGLVLFAVATHIANGIHGGRNPQHRCNQRKEQT